MSAGAYFEPLGEGRYRPTEHAQGAWHDDEIHFSPLSGLLTRAIQDHRRRAGTLHLALTRISFDILGHLAADECDVEVRTIRPGRSIELVEATVRIGGRDAAYARAWCLAESDTTSASGGAPPPLPAPGQPLPWGRETWSGGFVRSVERSPMFAEPGNASLWLFTPLQLVAGTDGEPVSDFLRLVDIANGVAVRETPKKWLFPNVDLTVHLHRQPAGPWVGLETGVIFGSNGQGLTSNVLHDLEGPVGVANQALTLRARDARET